MFEVISEVKFALSKPLKLGGSHVYVHPVIVDLGTRWT
jgi:hypothetical protein